jgi:hypothetical protein
MKLWHLSIFVMALGAACSVTSDNDPPGSEAKEATGTVQLELIGTDSQGTQYRLRDGVFRIYGYPDYYEWSTAGGASGSSSSSYYYEQVSTEDDPSSPVISRRVVPGYYEIYFASTNWYFEKLTPAGPVRVEESVLLSGRSQSRYVYDGGVANIYYQFGVDGTLIDFRSGDINIGVRIERPDDGQGGMAGVGGIAGAGGSF